MPTNPASLALDLTKVYPRSPRAFFAGYILAGRILDKCRALLNGTAGEYVYNSRLDCLFFDFAGINADDFKNFVATGATDDEVAAWIQAKAVPHTPEEIAVWNFRLKCGRICDLPPDRQAWIQEYLIAHVKPEVHGRVLFNFDMLDAEEGRLG